MVDNIELARSLKTKHPKFYIYIPDIEFNKDFINITHRFSIDGGIYFSPISIIYGNPIGKEDIIKRLCIYLSLVESLSYWKATYSPKIIIEPLLPMPAIEWYEDLLINGMMEYRYINGLPPSELPEIEWTEDTNTQIIANTAKNESLVLVSGGKDSTVTLSLISEVEKIKAFILNKLPAAERVMGLFPDIPIIRAERIIDNRLFELNDSGYLNGHTPFSALLSVISTIAGVLSDSKFIIASNESSAETKFANYNGHEVNHQYSKSYKYELKFKDLMDKTIKSAPLWFSFLRPLTEPQICKLLAKSRKLISHITSCNKNQSIGSWCGSCPKCVSTWILLMPYLEKNELINIFGQDVLTKNINLLPSLLGETDCRPLECVGTPGELRESLNYKSNDPMLLKYYLSSYGEHQIPDKYEKILLNHIRGL